MRKLIYQDTRNKVDICITITGRLGVYIQDDLKASFDPCDVFDMLVEDFPKDGSPGIYRRRKQLDIAARLADLCVKPVITDAQEDNE